RKGKTKDVKERDRNLVFACHETISLLIEFCQTLVYVPA
ncbi:MAG: hypothetical protein V7640_3074, partial [Betaproteobacteria bacterium]